MSNPARVIQFPAQPRIAHDCPPWCDAASHGPDSDGIAMRWHARLWSMVGLSWDGPGSACEITAQDAPATITPAQARELAAELLEAADLAERA